MKNLFFMVAFVLFVSCENGESLKKSFVEMSCDVYEECDFSETTRESCENFVSAVYDGNEPESVIDCMDCLEGLGCEMWTHGEKCEIECN